MFEAKQGVDQGAVCLTLVPGGPKAARTGHSKNVRGAGVRGTPDWLDAMRSGRHQAGNYAVHVTRRGDPKPPFLIVADVGHCFWIWCSFTRDAKDDYGDFEPNAAFPWSALERPEVVSLLRQIWLNPEALNDDVLGQRVTAEIASRVGDLALHLEKRFDPEQVGDFLMKCVFTMFAEDVEFLPRGLFSTRLHAWIEEIRQGKPSRFVRGLRALWIRMRDGGDLESGHAIRRFNGYLFRDPEPLDLDLAELQLLAFAAEANWRRVSPAIFGTLLERAIAPRERQRLGAFYTPEEYIRRLVAWTVMEPLREQWTLTRAQMEMIVRKAKDQAKAEAMARKLGHAFRKRLATVRVLDPACGSGNFLYVALKEMKRLEGEVIRALVAMGDKQTWLDIPGDTVHPSQFHGIEIKPWAAKIAELVLWIGYLQWQVSVGRLDKMPEPILQDLHHIRNSDALITWEREEAVVDERGRAVRRAVGVTEKKGTRSQAAVTRLVGVEVVPWPDADFVVGNPPFVGNKKMMDVLKPGYVEAVRKAFPEVPGNADLVMYWWWRSADLLSTGKIRRFGLVTTYTISQTFNRAVVEDALEKKSVKLVHALPNHPWYDEGAQIRIAMTVADREARTPTHSTVVDEEHTSAGELDLVRVAERPVEEIHGDLSVGARVRSTQCLRANEGLCSQGVTPLGDGFRLSEAEVRKLGVRLPHPVVKPYLIGEYVMKRPKAEWIIDFHGLSAEAAQDRYPKLFEHVVREVKPIREAQNDPSPKRKWWLFGRPRPEFRRAVAGLSRYVATSRTSRHRVFVFVAAETLPDTKIIAIATDDAAHLAILSSRVHVAWALRAGGKLGVGNDPTYNHTEVFDPFPFPSSTARQVDILRALANRLDAHRKARQTAHPSLTLTEMYGVLAKLRAGEPLDDGDEETRDQALADTLRQIHDEIDRAALAAYGWPEDISDEDIVSRLVDLNSERVQEEQRGLVRWIRPDYQVPIGVKSQVVLPGTDEATAIEKAAAGGRPSAKAGKLPWPADLPTRIQVLTALLRTIGGPMDTKMLASAFKGAKLDDVELTLRCAAAADAVVMVEGPKGGVRWAARE